MMDAVLHTDIPGVPRFSTGRVRDVYDLDNSLLIVTTDRISAFESVMPNAIPDKGQILTRLSRFWFLHLRPFVANHYITADIHFLSTRLAEAGVKMTHEMHDLLVGRSMLVVKTRVFP